MITGTSPSDCLVSYPRHSLGGILPLCRGAVSVFYSLLGNYLIVLHLEIIIDSTIVRCFLWYIFNWDFRFFKIGIIFWIISEHCIFSAIFFQVSFVLINLFLNNTQCRTHVFLITIKTIEGINASIRINVGIVILIDYILNWFWGVCNCFDSSVF